jgi:hypothetical protein
MSWTYVASPYCSEKFAGKSYALGLSKSKKAWWGSSGKGVADLSDHAITFKPSGTPYTFNIWSTSSQPGGTWMCSSTASVSCACTSVALTLLRSLFASQPPCFHVSLSQSLCFE